MSYKQNFILFILSLIILIGYLILSKDCCTDKKPKVIDLPEEWSEVKEGDTLQAYRVTADSVYLGFYNKANR